MIDVSDDYGIYNRFYRSRLRRQRSTQSSLQSSHVYRLPFSEILSVLYFVSCLTHFPSTLFFMLIVKTQTWMFLAAFIDAWPLWLFATALVSASVDLPTNWLSPEKQKSWTENRLFYNFFPTVVSLSVSLRQAESHFHIINILPTSFAKLRANHHILTRWSSELLRLFTTGTSRKQQRMIFSHISEKWE